MTSAPRRTKKWLRWIGPGIITGASDDDPAGIATYSQAGAQFGTSLLWTMPLSLPLMSAVQIMCGRVGRTSGHGVAHHLRTHHSIALAWAIVGLLVVANVINIAADAAAMGAAAALILPGPALAYAVLLTGGSFAAVAFLRYRSYANVLRYLVLSLFAYVATAFVVEIDWTVALRDTLLPRFSWDAGFWSMVVAIFGTTISPYLFFWQSSHEVEQAKENHDAPLRKRPSAAPEELTRINYDTFAGMLLSNGVAFVIMLVCAATIHASGVRDIESAEAAAEALRPLAGDVAFILFASGIVGTGLLALPILAGSAAFAVCEMQGWSHSLDRTLPKERRFYAVFGAILLAGVGLNAFGFNVIDFLVFSAVVNGVVAVPLLFLMVRLGTRKKVMGPLPLPLPVRILVWATTVLMASAVLVMFATMLA